MRLLDIIAVGTNFVYRWPEGNQPTYPHWVEYRASGTDHAEHRVRIGFLDGETVYGRPRKRAIVWIDGRPLAAFMGADDFDTTGDLLCEITGADGRICRHPDGQVPEEYSDLRTVGLRTRVSGERVHNAWAVVANIGDHAAMSAIAAIRHTERVT